jgi:RNA polymerase sigma-70 factor (ECF subfamily)
LRPAFARLQVVCGQSARSVRQLPEDLARLTNPGSESARALAERTSALYSELRRIAGYYLRQERRDHTLQATALVHEVYLRLVDQRGVQWENRNQFLGIAAQLMRRILLDYSRSHRASKRGGNAEKVFLQEASVISKTRPADVVALDEALTRLAEIDSQQAHLVELRFFGGLSIEETAGVLEVSPATVKRNWVVAKAWLARVLAKPCGDLNA